MSDPEIFISYSSRDVVRVRELARALESAGLSVWRDQDRILGGQNYGPKIVDGIKSSKALLLACSDASLRSKNVKQEIQLAWTYDIPYLPVLLERTNFPEQVEYWLAGWQWVEWLDEPESVWLPKVLSALRALGIGSDQPNLPAQPVVVPAQPAAPDPVPLAELWRLARFSDLFWPVPAQAEAVRHPRLRDLGAPQSDVQHRFPLGSAVRLRLDSPKDGYLTVIDLGTSRTNYLLCPSEFAPTARISAGTNLLPQEGSRYSAFEASGPPGREQVMAIVSDTPIDLGVHKDAAPAARLSDTDLGRLTRLLRERPSESWMAFATYFDIG